MRPPRIAILASGTGSNAQALIRKAQDLGTDKLEIIFVLSDQEEAPVLEKARDLGVPAFLRMKFADRRTHEESILMLLKEHRIDWVLLAGYMRLLSPYFIKTLQSWHQGASQVVNIHPSLLPAYPGLDSIARAYADQVSESGVTLHLVDDGMDTGPILRQQRILRGPETLPEWTAQFHRVEHQIYGAFLADIAEGHQKTCYFMET
nr:phosphoribosylglycinamide formyltransferase [Bdellovibrio sp. HAGR004]